jgi:hypothetical protein
MTRRGLTIPLVLFLTAAPLAAQTASDRIQQLETRLEEVIRQAEEIRRELNAIKGVSEQDLTAVEVAEPVGAPPSALTDVQPVVNAANPVAAKALNPDISVVGTFIGHAGQQNLFEEPSAIDGGFGPGEGRDPLGLDEVEVAYEAFIDPYAKGRFFIAVGPDEVDLEEGYANFIALGKGFTAKVGKTKATFGKANTWHTHTRPWIDQPLMIGRFFGAEGLSDVGASVSKTFDVPGVFLEATGEVYSGNAGDAFARQNDNDLLFNGHLKLFRDITESSNIEAGTSFARGTLPDSGGSNRMAGVDLTYRWRPLAGGTYRSLIARFEGLTNRRADLDQNLYGFYASADYRLGRRWYAGARIDRADRTVPFISDGEFDLTVVPERFTDRAVSATLTFWPSEFSQVRGQFRRSRYAGLDTVNEFLIQLQFSIGAHGAHTF